MGSCLANTPRTCRWHYCNGRTTEQCYQAHSQGIHNHLVFSWKISYMHVMPFDKLHHPSAPLLQFFPYLLSTFLPIGSFFPRLSSLSAAHMYMRVEPASEAELASQWSPCRAPALPSCGHPAENPLPNGSGHTLQSTGSPQHGHPAENPLSHSSHCWQRASQPEGGICKPAPSTLGI